MQAAGVTKVNAPSASGSFYYLWLGETRYTINKNTETPINVEGLTGNVKVEYYGGSPSITLQFS